MRVVVFGATGMLGHMLMRVLTLDPRYEVFGTIRGSLDKFPQLSRYQRQIIQGIDVADETRVARLLTEISPQYVINAAAMRPTGLTPEATIDFVRVNALWPHQLANMAGQSGIRLCHISSDGVFSGKRGGYSEDDRPDPEDIYGAAKLTGEPPGQHVVSLRTSIIGPELNGGAGLLSWLLQQDAPIKGYSRWLYSGLTTLELANIIRDRVLPNGHFSGVCHVAGEPISKFQLLRLLSQVYGHDILIEEDSSVVRDRTLVAKRFFDATGYKPPSWTDMISALFRFGRL